jgi:hypothetical protein
MRLGKRRRNGMGLPAGRHHRISDGDDRWQIDAVPIDSAGWVDANEPGVQPGAQVHHDGVGVLGGEIPDPVVEHFGAQRHLAHHAGGHAQSSEVVVDFGDDLVGKRVTQDGTRPAAIQRPGVLGQKRGLFHRAEIADVDSHHRRTYPA